MPNIKCFRWCGCRTQRKKNWHTANKINRIISTDSSMYKFVSVCHSHFLLHVALLPCQSEAWSNNQMRTISLWQTFKCKFIYFKYHEGIWWIFALSMNILFRMFPRAICCFFFYIVVVSLQVLLQVRKIIHTWKYLFFFWIECFFSASKCRHFLQSNDTCVKTCWFAPHNGWCPKWTLVTFYFSSAPIYRSRSV